MGHVIVRRPPRSSPKRPKDDVRELAAAPPAPGPAGPVQGLMQVLLPALGGLSMVMFMIARGEPIFLVAGLVMITVSIGGGAALFISQRTGARKQATSLRQRYLVHLEEERELLRAAARAQTVADNAVHPAPVSLIDVAALASRRWERRPSDRDFLSLRIGVGTVPRAVRPHLPPPTDALEVKDLVCLRAGQQLVSAHTSLPNQPVVIPVQPGTTVTVVGDSVAARAVGRALLAQLTVAHSPDDVRVAVACPVAALPEWDWIKWLPHTLNDADHDGAAPRRLTGVTLSKLLEELRHDPALRGRGKRADAVGRKLISPPHPVILIDETGLVPRGFTTPESVKSLHEMRAAVIRLVPSREAEPEHVDVRVTVEGNELTIEYVSLSESQAIPVVSGEMQAPVSAPISGSARMDVFSREEAEALARTLAPFRLHPEAGISAQPLTANADLTDLLGAGDAETYDIDAMWRRRDRHEFLRVPIGLTANGQPLILDLKESAHGGMGPHGLCVGATGSGKSELLRTLVLALAMKHTPEELSLVLVDYKGGATFAGMEDLPHTGGVITNLSDDLGLVDRMRDALQGEMKRRQQLLLQAGNMANVAEYAARRGEHGLPPLPNLLVVVDEFSELLSAKPEFIDLFIAIGRIGRSIGIHMLLASQRLDEGRLRGLESFLSYRIGLRTFNAEESRAVLGVPDAYELPPVPGSAYLKVDTSVFERFKAAYVSAPISAKAKNVDVDTTPVLETYELNNRSAPGPISLQSAEPESATAPAYAAHREPTVLDVVVARLARAAEPVHQVWLPPLPNRMSLDAVMRMQDNVDEAPAEAGTSLRIRIGMLDRPTEQRKEPLTLDFSGALGHLAIVGAPQSGKSLALRTLVTSAAWSYAPCEVAFHCIDFGGGALAGLEEFPHVGTVCGRRDPERVRRTVHEIAAALDEREQLFAERGINSAEHMRRLWRKKQLPELPYADLFLVIDNYAALKTDFEELLDVITDIASRGLTFGIHVVVTTTRFMDIRPALQTLIGGRLELRLNDPLDSSIDRQLAKNLPGDLPGRCLTAEKRIGQIAIPRLDGSTDLTDISELSTDMAREFARWWEGPSVAPVRLLPPLVPHSALPAAHAGQTGVPIGIGESNLEPVYLDLFGADQHVLAFGDRESGKTALLRTIIRGYVEARTSDEIAFIVVDPRRTLLGAVPDTYLGGYAPTAQAAAGLAQNLAAKLRERMPPPDVTVDKLRDRSWWSGPEVVLLVDDYDLLASGGMSPLAPLLEFLPQARDIGFHVVLNRHSGGAGRALFEPVLQRLREIGATGLVFSGDRQEGQLWPGVYPAAQPPGRATLVRRRQRPLLIQTAYAEETARTASGF